MCDLYYTLSSPPCRSVMMLAKALGVPLNLKKLNTTNQEHMTPEFLKINPQHTIPTLVDNDFAIWESRAIMAYLVEKYGKNDDSLYPRDPKKRAVINQRLYFDMGVLYQRFFEYFIPQLREKLPADPEKLKKVQDALEFLNQFLSKSKFVAGDDFTIADYSLVSTFSVFVVADFDYSSYENVKKWYELCNKTLPGIEINAEGIEAMKEYMKAVKART